MVKQYLRLTWAWRPQNIHAALARTDSVGGKTEHRDVLSRMSVVKGTPQDLVVLPPVTAFFSSTHLPALQPQFASFLKSEMDDLDFALKYSRLSPYEQEALLNGPAMDLPPGVRSNFDNPSNMDTLGLTILSICTVISFAAILVRGYSRVFFIKKVTVSDYSAIVAFVSPHLDTMYSYE